MKLVIPVECQNGHKARAYMQITGLEAKYLGVPPELNCACPKSETAWQGWRAVGEPAVVAEGEEPAILHVLWKAPRCTWVDCSSPATTPQRSQDGTIWANLCDQHARKIDELFDSDPKEILSNWVKAQGGAKAAAARMFDEIEK